MSLKGLLYICSAVLAAAVSILTHYYQAGGASHLIVLIYLDVFGECVSGVVSSIGEITRCQEHSGYEQTFCHWWSICDEDNPFRPSECGLCFPHLPPDTTFTSMPPIYHDGAAMVVTYLCAAGGAVLGAALGYSIAPCIELPGRGYRIGALGAFALASVGFMIGPLIQVPPDCSGWLPNASGCFRARPGVPLGPRAQATSFSQQAILPEGDFCALHNAGSPAAALEQPLSPTCLGQAPVHYLSQRFGAVINLSILPPFTVLAISQLRAAMVAITTLSRVYLHNEVTRVMSIVGLTTSIGVFLAKFGIAVWM